MAIKSGAVDVLIGILQKSPGIKLAFGTLFIYSLHRFFRVKSMECLMAITTDLEGQREAIEAGLCDILEQTLLHENNLLVVCSIKVLSSPFPFFFSFNVSIS